MKIFDYSFIVQAPLSRVVEFHRDARALKKLTPPPMIARMHLVEPLAEGSRARFTLWLGPIPIHWLAVHSRVDMLHGFTDTQVSGPMQFWQHTHQFSALDEKTTRVSEHIEYEHKAGLPGLFTRILFSRAGLRFLFAYRAFITRKMCAKAA